MNRWVYISDVAKVAGVNKSTVSRVLNGKAKACRIPPVTQNRVRAAASQLGYQRNPNTRFPAAPTKPTPAAPPPTTSEAGTLQSQERTIALVLAANSPATTLALIPGLEPILSAENYCLNLVTLPTDPTVAQEKISRLGLTSGGILCCPSVYPTVVAMREKTRIPVIVLWQGAARAMMKTLSGEQNEMESNGQSEERNREPVIGSQATSDTVIHTPPPRPVPAPVSEDKPVQTQAPKVMPTPVIVETPTPVVPPAPPPPVQPPPPDPVPTPDLQETPASPPLMPEAPPSTPEPPITPEPTPTPAPEPAQIQEPVIIPAPVIEETLTPVVPPEPLPLQEPVTDSTQIAPETPAIAPEPAVMVEPTPASMPETTQETVPFTTPELADSSLPDPTQEPQTIAP